MAKKHAPGSRARYMAGWADEKREELIKTLGGKCAKCGTRSHLEFDHPNGRDWEPSKHSRWQRIINYRREAELGQIRLLCLSCNANSGKGPGGASVASTVKSFLDAIPF